jgi:hypothetical protein
MLRSAVAAGRPSDYTQDLADRLCEQLADGKSMRKVCEQDWAPDKASVFKWLRTKPEFLDQYTRAKAEAADSMVDDMQDIADDARNDFMTANDPNNPGYKLNGEHINRSRLRVDTRKWIASKLKPKKYGEKLDIDHAGSLSLTVVTGVPSND